MIAYAISDPTTLRFDHRFQQDLRRFASRADWLLYRDKRSAHYAAQARRIAEACDAFPSLRLLLHDDWALARELGVGGVHFSGRGIGGLDGAKRAGLFTVASTHSIGEAEALERAGIDAVTLSPVFPSPGKGDPLGLEVLAEAVRRLKIPVIALGGIVDREAIAAVEKAGAAGYASIRLFGEGERGFAEQSG
jgi:thiamine-phosphate pyrophosphorylase